MSNLWQPQIFFLTIAQYFVRFQIWPTLISTREDPFVTLAAANRPIGRAAHTNEKRVAGRSINAIRNLGSSVRFAECLVCFHSVVSRSHLWLLLMHTSTVYSRFTHSTAISCSTTLVYIMLATGSGLPLFAGVINSKIFLSPGNFSFWIIR